MIPIIYKADETNFTHRGLGSLKDSIEATVTEYKNGAYQLYLQYPLYEPKANEIKEETIIKASTPTGEQLFRIYKTSPNVESGIKEIFANHIFYDLKDNFIEDTNIIEKNAMAAGEQILNKTTYKHPFKFFSDIDTIKNARLVRRNVVEAIMDTSLDASMLNRWGGELDRNNFTVRLLAQRGKDRGIVIKDGKNLKGLKIETDISEVVTKIIPMGYDGLMLPEKYIESFNISKYINPKIQKIEFSDIIAINEEEEYQVEGAVPKEEAYEKLRIACKELFENENIDKPTVNVTIDFVELSKTEEYKEYSILETIYPWDIVIVKHKKLGTNIKVKMCYYQWDSLKEKYISIELGNAKGNFLNTVGTVNYIKNTIDEVTPSILNQAKENATFLITNGLKDSYVIVRKDEIIIGDTNDINTMTKCWRWNRAGLGFSNTGYNGNFELAMTCDGAIVADFITTGNLNASVITTGIIKSRDGSCILNLDTGDFVLGSDDTVAKYTKKYAEFRHSNGESTRMDSSGFYRNGRPYHSLLASGTEITGGSAGAYPKTVTISLGDEWKGKTFKVIPSVQDFSGSGESIEYLHRLYLNIDSYDYINATFTATGYWVAIRDNAGVVETNEKELRWSWIAIGG